MSFFQALVLGLLQGATEFIPVSSSGHLTLVPWLFSWTFDPTFKGAFDVLAHWGTLLAVVAVFWRDLWDLLQGGLRTLGGLDLRAVSDKVDEADKARPTHLNDIGRPGGQLGRWLCGFLARIEGDAQGRLAWRVVVGSVPAAVVGFALEDFFEMLFGTPRIVSVLLWVTAGLLAFSEWSSGRRGQQGRDLEELTWLDALFIGLGQAMAIAPGISRSGATIASGLVRGIRRETAARFSFLLSTPVILGAGVWQLKDLFASSGWTAHLGPMVVGFLASAVSGYTCIRFLLSYLRRNKLYPFAVYCALAGTGCLILSFVR